jgi:lipoyl(octanoyl) transferase
VHRLEAWIIASLGEYGIRGERREGRPGIWVKGGGRDEKIAAIGVRVRRWVTYHGASINICPDLSHFDGIVPCGIHDAGVTSIAKIEANPRIPGQGTIRSCEN